MSRAQHRIERDERVLAWGVRANDTLVLRPLRRRLMVDHMSPAQAERLQLLHGSLTYRDKRLEWFRRRDRRRSCEHLDPPRLSAFERVLFEFARPGWSC